MKGKFSLFMLLALLSLALFGCTAEKSPSDKEKGSSVNESSGTDKTLKMVFQTEPPNLDPQISTDNYSMMINNAVREGLVRLKDGEIIPGLATEWDISEDGLEYTFKLRESKWSDGSALTAEDIKRSFIRLLEPDTKSQYAYIAYYIKNAQKFNEGEATAEDVGVSAPDENTVVVTLESPTKYFLSLMGFLSFLPSDAENIEKHGEKYAADADKMLYNGPFVLSEWKHQESLVLEKNPNYWNKDEINLERVEISIVPDDSTAVGMYETGEIDLVLLGRDYIEKYDGQGKANFYNKGSIMFMQYNFDGEIGKILSNANFREALSYTIDREGLVNGLLKNGSQAAERYVVPTTLGVTSDFGEEFPLAALPTSSDKAKAEELLDKALEELNMTKNDIPTFEYLTSDKPDDKMIAEAIQDMLVQNLGINLDIKIVQSKQKLQLLLEGDYELMWAGWGPDFNDPLTYLDIFTTSSGYNTSGFNDAKYDKLIADINKELDPQKRGELLFEAEKYLISDGPVMPVFFAGGAYAKVDNLVNIRTNHIGPEIDFVFADFE